MPDGQSLHAADLEGDAGGRIDTEGLHGCEVGVRPGLAVLTLLADDKRPEEIEPVPPPRDAVNRPLQATLHFGQQQNSITLTYYRMILRYRFQNGS